MSTQQTFQNPIPLVNVPHQFSYENGITVTKVEPGFAQGVLEASENSVNPHGQIHGGALATLMDTVSGCCACSKGGSCVTANCTMEFLRPAAGPTITCVSTPKKLGRTLSVVQAELKNVEGKVVATGTYTFFMYPEE
jgi:acyl-CoA thioesterase